MRVAVIYEHPEWFIPLFAALERRGLDVLRVDATSLRWDPTERPDFSLLLNRMSPSSHTRGHGHAIHAAASYIDWVESYGVPVVNGSAAYRLELSKSAQVDLLRRLDIRYPRARVINNVAEAPEAARGLTFPIVIKPNIGGSGAGIQRFDTAAALGDAMVTGAIHLGIDSTALVQEFLPARGGTITRLEILDGELLYAIEITPPAGHGFNLCPADICQADATPEPASFEACPARPAMAIANATPAREDVEAGLRIAKAARLDVCGIEYLIDDRDGRSYVYDINALSNFVTDASRIVGFDPFERFAEYVGRRVDDATSVLIGTGSIPNP
jgi:glutathione synthase/RimK-type ligase-like ATP-grasp enzyme